MTNYVHIIALNERKFGNTSFQTAYKRRISNFFYKKKKKEISIVVNALK